MSASGGPHLIDAFVGRLDRLIAAIIAVARWLALPLVLLLFLQWPLRDIVRGYSREANDLGQIFFALFVAVSITAATRAGTHLAADTLAHRYPPGTRAVLRKAGIVLGLAPWTVIVLATAAAPVWNSVRGVEAFPDTNNPGYFLVKLALSLLAGTMLLQGLADLLRREGEP